MATLRLYRYRVIDPSGAKVGGGVVYATDWAAAHRTAHGLLANPACHIAAEEVPQRGCR